MEFFSARQLARMASSSITYNGVPYFEASATVSNPPIVKCPCPLTAVTFVSILLYPSAKNWSRTSRNSGMPYPLSALVSTTPLHP